MEQFSELIGRAILAGIIAAFVVGLMLFWWECERPIWGSKAPEKDERFIHLLKRLMLCVAVAVCLIFVILTYTRHH